MLAAVRDGARGQTSKLNHLRRADVFTGANFAQQLFAERGVEIQHGQRRATGLIPAERHRGNVHAVVAEQRADAPNHPGAIGVFQNE